MTIFRTVAFSVFFSFACCYSSPACTLPEQEQECNEVELKLETKDTSDGRDNGSVSVEIVRGDAKHAKYIIVKVNGGVVNEGRFTSNKIDGLKKGEYLCIVAASQCTKKVSFSIN